MGFCTTALAVRRAASVRFLNLFRVTAQARASAWARAVLSGLSVTTRFAGGICYRSRVTVMLRPGVPGRYFGAGHFSSSTPPGVRVPALGSSNEIAPAQAAWTTGLMSRPGYRMAR